MRSFTIQIFDRDSAIQLISALDLYKNEVGYSATNEVLTLELKKFVRAWHLNTKEQRQLNKLYKTYIE